MSEQVWYLYQNGQQVGPFDDEQVSQLFLNNMIAKDGYIFKIGWKDWRPVEEGYEALGIPNPNRSTMSPGEYDAHIEKRQKAAPRASIHGRVVVHNNGQLTIGRGVNISVGGIFVETNQQLFSLGEVLKLSVRCDGLAQAFNVEAIVIRYNIESKFPAGYGLKFCKIDPKIQQQIQTLVNEANNRGDVGRFAAQ